MVITKIEPGLWRWTGLHPDWKPEEGGPEGWEQEVGCIYYEAPDATVLIDPLVPPEDPEHFYEALDRDVERIGRRVVVLLTVFWHARSAKALVERYGATLWADPLSARLRDITITADSPPETVVPLGAVRRGEVMFWLPERRVIVVGDVLLGTEDPRLRVCSASWVQEGQYPALLDSLSGLKDLPIERVLVSHGSPVLAGGREAIARALL